MKETILLLASDPVARRAICHALESGRYCVLPTDNVDGAARWLRETTPDLLIVRQVRQYTESMSGYEAAIFLRRISNGIPVLILGGQIEDADLQNRENLHRFEAFPKPFAATELLEKVGQMLFKHSAASNAPEA
jgi:DNA-binding response OmpR family regulator